MLRPRIITACSELELKVDQALDTCTVVLTIGIKMFDSAELRVHMTGKAILRTGAKTQGQGHETTWAQIVAHELGIPADDIVVEEPLMEDVPPERAEPGAASPAATFVINSGDRS